MSAEMEAAQTVYAVLADHPMWVGDDGEPLDYSPVREARIADFLREIETPLAEALAKARREALAEAADTWQWGAWADAPRCADRVQERLANAQYVTNWLRTRDALAGGSS